MRAVPHSFTLRQIQYIVAVAELSSFRRAAELCRVAQPSLSAQVAQVEEALGVVLFERDRRGALLTAAGKAFVQRAGRLLVQADELVEAARALRDPFSGSLRLGVIPTIAPYLLPDVAPALRAAFPKLSFVWIEDKTARLTEFLEAGEIDAALLALEADLGQFSQLILAKDPFVFAAAPSHPLAKSKKALRAEELDGETVLLLDEGHCFREQALSFCAGAGAEESGYRSTSLPTLVQIAAGGAGITLLPALALAVENRRHTLAIRPFAAPAPARTLALVWRKQAALEVAIRAVGQTLKSACGPREPSRGPELEAAAPATRRKSTRKRASRSS